jgi:hypothetical protein
MLDGIKLLIERMDQYPEEFFGDLSFRWSEIMQDIAKHGPEFLEEDDLMLLNKKVKEIRRRELSAKITEEIATQARLQVAQERQSKVDIQRNMSTAIYKGEGQKVWWTDNGNSALIGVDTARNLTSGYDPNSETFFGRGLLDMIERGKDNATLQNIRATNRDLEAQLAQSKAEIAKRDEARKQSQAYKKRNNQNWK